MKDKKIDFKVGIFVISALALLMLFIAQLEGNSQGWLNKNMTIKAKLKNANGLLLGAKVTINGLSVGSVTNIEIYESVNILATLSINKNAAEHIKEGSYIQMAAQGLLGDKYLNIMLPADKAHNMKIANNATLPVEEALEVQHFIDSGSEVIFIAKQALESLNNIIKSFEKANRSDTFFKNLAELSKNLLHISEALSNKVQKLEINTTINLVNQILGKINDGKGTLGLVINDPSVYDQIKGIIGGINRNRVVRNFLRESLEDSVKKEP